MAATLSLSLSLFSLSLFSPSLPLPQIKSYNWFYSHIVRHGDNITSEDINVHSNVFFYSVPVTKYCTAYRPIQSGKIIIISFNDSLFISVLIQLFDAFQKIIYYAQIKKLHAQSLTTSLSHTKIPVLILPP